MSREHTDLAIPPDRIERQIFIMRGKRVMLDSELAKLYGVPTRRLNEQVKRNQDRFPGDFSFRLTAQEFAALMSQNATSNVGRGGRRKLPLVFTEQEEQRRVLEQHETVID